MQSVLSEVAGAAAKFLAPNIKFTDFVRHASKKTKTSTQNVHTKSRPKHRGWKRADGQHVQAGTILVLQRTLRFFPGLNVGFGRNASLFAMEPGKVVVTCEKVDLNWDHTWVQKHFAGREDNTTIYKKYYNVIPDPQHTRFKLIDEI